MEQVILIAKKIELMDQIIRLKKRIDELDEEIKQIEENKHEES